MTHLYLLEPDPSPAWEPFTLCRPVAELRAGVLLFRERWELATGCGTTALLSTALAGFEDTETPPVRPLDARIPGPAVVARSEFLPGEPLPAFTDPIRLVGPEGRTVLWYVPEGSTWKGPEDAGASTPVLGRSVDRITGLLDLLDDLLPADCTACVHDEATVVPHGAIVLGDAGTLCAAGAAVEPGVVFDLREGPVVLEPGAVVRSGSRLEGPLYVHGGTSVLGGTVRRSVIGPHCRIHGEVSHSIFIGYSNKSHDGFVGHSIVGQWVNLGAGTITSNLKNTYGAITLHTSGGPLPTDRINIGSLIGDHVKTAIGTLLPTGTIIGPGASLHGENRIPRRVLPFAWGSAGDRLRLDSFLQTAERVLPRRGVPFTEGRAASLRSLYARCAPHDS